MAPLLLPHCLRFLTFLLFLLLFVSSFFVFASSQSQFSLGRRNLLEKTELDDFELPKNKKSSIVSSSKNQTKPLKPIGSKKNQTKLSKPVSSTSNSKNQTKISKPISSKNVGATTNLTKLKLTTTKKLNSTKLLLDPLKSNSLSKNKTKSSSNPIKETTKLPKPKNQNQNQNQKTKEKQKTVSPPTWMYQEEDEGDDFLAEIRDLPTKFHKTIVPDLHRISTTSRIYLTKANKEITKNYIKPYVGNNKYSSSIATAISCAFIIVPFLLVSLIFNRIKAFFSLQKLVIFIQIYLAIYFSILCLSSLITGLEPLRFFYATSQSTYVWLQVLQTLGYVMYLLMLMMYLVLVFSTETGLGQKFLGLAQTFVGFSVGLHYYMTVFHRVVLHQPPKTNWKVHGIYATCFLVICLFAHAERRKKAYFEEGGEEGKQS